MKNIRIKSGRFFPKPFIFLAYALIVFGVFLSFESVLGIAVIIIALFFAFAPQIVEINQKEKFYRNSLSVLGLTFGSWQSYKDFPFISLLKSDIVDTIYGGRTNQSLSTKNSFYILYLLDKNHRNKIMLNSYKDKAKAMEHLDYYSEKLALEKTVFSPKILQSTLNKRKR